MSFYRNNPPLLPDWVHLCKHLHPQWNKTERTWKFEAHNFQFVFSFHIISCFSCCISLFHAHFHIGFIFFCIAFNPFLWLFLAMQSSLSLFYIYFLSLIVLSSHAFPVLLPLSFPYLFYCYVIAAYHTIFIYPSCLHVILWLSLCAIVCFLLKDSLFLMCY